MSSLIKRCQRQTLVYWERTGTAKTGEPIWGPPTEMTCRWEDRLQEIITSTNTRVMSSVEVITETRLQVGGLIKLGTMATVAYWDTPKQNDGIYEVLKSSETPNLRNTESLYEACA